MRRGNDRLVHTRTATVRGFSLIEVTVGVAILGVAFAALAPVFVQITHLVAEAGDESRAVAAAMSRMEQLSALVFEQDAATLAATTDTTTGLASAVPNQSGTGLQRSGPSPLIADNEGFVDWVGPQGKTLADARSQVRLVRRWSVSGLPLTWNDESLLLQVFSRQHAREAGEASRSGFGRRPGDVWLFSARARSLR